MRAVRGQTVAQLFGLRFDTTSQMR